MSAPITLRTLLLLPPLQMIAFAGPDKDVITPAPVESRWRFGIGYARMLGIKADFSGLGTFGNSFQPQPLGGGRDYNYDDGFVRVDSSGNRSNETWNWSYENAAQYDSSGSGSLDFSITGSNATASDQERDSGGGLEISGYYDMGAVEWVPLKARGAAWGFRGGVQHTRIDIASDDWLLTSMTRTIDRFELNGIIPPAAPYVGSFSGPGPLLGDNPSRSVIAGGNGSVSGQRELDVHLAIANFGSYLSIPVTPKWNFITEAGVNLGIGSGTYEFNSTTTVTGLGAQESSGKESKTRLMTGIYAGIAATYEIDEQWMLQCSGRYQYLDNLDFETDGSTAELSFDSAFVLTIGAVYSF